MNLDVCMWNVIACDVDDLEMMLMLMMTIRWDDVDVDDVIEMNASCVCTWGYSDLV